MRKIFRCFRYEKEIDRIMSLETDGLVKRDRLYEYASKYNIAVDPKFLRKPDTSNVYGFGERIDAIFATYDNQAFGIYKSIKEYFEPRKLHWVQVFAALVGAIVGVIGSLIANCLT